MLFSFLLIGSCFSILVNYHNKLLNTEPEHIKKIPARSNREADITIRNITLNHPETDFSSKITACKATINRKKNIILCKQAVCTFFKNDHIFGTLQAPSMLFDKQRNIITLHHATGSMHAMTLTGQNVEYNLTSNKIFIDGGVTTTIISSDSQQAP